MRWWDDVTDSVDKSEQTPGDSREQGSLAACSPCWRSLAHHARLCDPVDCSPPGSLYPWYCPGDSPGVGCHFLLQGIFPAQELSWGLLHCRQTLYQLSHLACVDGMGSRKVRHD